MPPLGHSDCTKSTVVYQAVHVRMLNLTLISSLLSVDPLALSAIYTKIPSFLSSQASLRSVVRGTTSLDRIAITS